MFLLDRELKEGKALVIDLAAPPLAVAASDRRAFAVSTDAFDCAGCEQIQGIIIRACVAHRQPALIVPRAVRLALREIVAARFKQEMGRKDRKVWGAWQEVLDSLDDPDAMVKVEVSVRMMKWLYGHLKDDEKVNVRPGVAQWCEVLADYFRGVLEAAAVTED